MDDDTIPLFQIDEQTRNFDTDLRFNLGQDIGFSQNGNGSIYLMGYMEDNVHSDLVDELKQIRNNFN